MGAPAAGSGGAAAATFGTTATFAAAAAAAPLGGLAGLRAAAATQHTDQAPLEELLRDPELQALLCSCLPLQASIHSGQEPLLAQEGTGGQRPEGEAAALVRRNVSARGEGGAGGREEEV